MKLLYIEISPADTFNDNGAKMLKDLYPGAEVIVPTLPVDPLDIFNALKKEVDNNQPEIIIGVGLGGTLVQSLYGHYRILINPIFILPQFIGELYISTAEGKQRYMYTPQQQAIVHKWLDNQFAHIPYGEEKYIYGLFAAQDDFILYSETFFKQHFKYNFNYEGIGLLTKENWADNVIPIIDMLNDQQNQVQKPIAYVDMDGVLVDFMGAKETLTPEEKEKYGTHIEDVPGIFSRMKPMPGAIEAFKQLSRHYDIYILSTAPWDNESAWSDKARWVKKHLGIYGYKRLILTHRKDLNEGAILIDDRAKKGAAQFDGVWLQFGKHPFNNWEDTHKILVNGHPETSNGDASKKEEFPEDNRPIMYVDMDSVLVNFAGAVATKLTPEEKEKYRDHYDDVPDIFSRMEPIEGAVEAFKLLTEHYNTYILSTAPWDNDRAWTDKLRWVKKYLGNCAKKRIVLSHHKDLNQGSFLIDDSSRNGAKEFCGKWFQFGKAPYENWDKMLKALGLKN